MRVGAKHGRGDGAYGDFPPKVEVPKSFVREHERLELEAEHLREQLDEHKRYITSLRQRIENEEEIDEVVQPEEIDRENGKEGDPYRLG
jgi:regulator of replication initiation timing